MCWYPGTGLESQPMIVPSTRRLRVHRAPLFRVQASALVRARTLKYDVCLAIVGSGGRVE
jgi:hypothetical protein